MLKTPFIFVCLVFVIYMMRQNDITLSKGLRHSFRILEDRILDSGPRPSISLCSGVTYDESYSEGDIKKSETFISNMQKLRGGNPLEDWVLNGNEDTVVDDYVVPMIPWIAPWPVLGIITLLTCIGFVSNWCCIFGCCKNCKCCKCCKPAKEQGRVKLYMLISVFFLLCMVGCGAAGLVFSPKITKGINVTFCSALTSVENMVYGEPTFKWMGFDSLLVSLNDIKDQFLGVVNTLSDISGDQTNFNNAYTAAVNANDDLYTNNNGKPAVTRADPSKGTYTPDYLANLGPSNTQGTYTYYIKQELDAWYNTVDTATSSINSAVDSLQGDQAAIEGAINSGIDSAQSILDSLNNVIDTLSDNGDQVKDGIKGAGYGLIALFGVNLLFSLVAILSIAMFGIVKIKFFSKVLHFSWCVINLMTILGFILSTLILPGSIVMMESCEVFRLALNDQDFFEEVTSKVFEGRSSNAQTILNTCFHGSGDALERLGLTNQLDYFDTIYGELDKVDALIPLDETYSATNPPPSVVIPAQLFLVNQYLTGKLPDKDTTAADLQALNKATNTNTHSCVNLKDLWILNSVNCTDSSYYVFQNADNENENVGSKTCLGFDQWVSPKNIDNRYTATYFPTGCTNPDYATVKALVNGFVDNRATVASYFTDIKNDLTTVSDRQRDFSVEAYSFVDGLQDVKRKVKNLRDSILGEENGVIPNTNCKFVGTNLRTLQASMCTGMMSNVYQAAIILIVMSVTALFATIFTFCLAKKFSVRKESKPTQFGQTQQNESAFAFKTVM